MPNGLRSLRLKRSLTQSEAAARMKMSYGQYIKLERGERQLTERTIHRAVAAFDATFAEVLIAANGKRRTLPLKGIDGRSPRG